MYIYVSYDNSTKKVLSYEIVSSKKTNVANSTNGYKINVELNNEVPKAFYESYDQYEVVISGTASSQSATATLSLMTGADTTTKRKLGGTRSDPTYPYDLPNLSPYESIETEISGDLTSGIEAYKRASAIIALPWASERSNTISCFGTL